MIVNNLHVRWPRCPVEPPEANPPLIVNADAELTLAVATERFKAIAGQGGKVPQGRGCFQTVKLQPRRALKSGERLDPLSGGEISGPLVAEADNHRPKISGVTRYVKRSDLIHASKNKRPTLEGPAFAFFN